MKWITTLFSLLLLGVVLFGGYQFTSSSSSDPSPKDQFRHRLKPSKATGEKSSLGGRFSPGVRERARSVGFEAARVDDGFDRLELSLLDGDDRSLSAYRGRWVLLNFWATWCVPCREEMPSLEQLQEKFDPEEFRVLAVNVMEPRTDVRSFVEEQGLSLSVFLDREGELTEKFGVEGLPVTWLLSPKGEPLMRVQGEREWDRGDPLRLFEMITTDSNG